MLKNTLYLLIAYCFLTSCEDYDWSTKVIFEGRVVDPNGNPVSNVAVGTYIDGHRYHSNFESDVVSHTLTDANGNYRMMFPDPNNEDDIVLLINSDRFRNPINPALSTAVTYNISEQNYNDYLINFGEAMIFNVDQMTTLAINAENVAGLEDYIVAVEVIGMAQQNPIDYNFNFENPENQYFFTEPYNVAVNQTILIRYTKETYGQNGPVTTTTDIPVQIGTEPVTYTVNY